MPTDDIKFTWDDLIIENITPEEATRWLSEWHWFEFGRISPIFLSRFGNWFFQRPDGAVYFFEITEGTLESIAPDFASFQSAVNTLEFQEKYLYSALLMRYRRQGFTALNRQVIGFAPHPALTGSLDNCKPMVFDMFVWQLICAQTLRQIRGVP